MRQFPDLPARMKKLPLSDKGFPVPFFATWENGIPDFRVVSAEKMASAVRHGKCWICGEPLGAFKAFVIGPMCGITRTISDPPSHRECATFAAKHCPFMANPAAKRNARNLPADAHDAPGVGLKRNPGAVAVWVTKSFKPFRAPGGGTLFDIGEAESVEWFASGRQATRAEVEASVDSGIGYLVGAAEAEGPEAVSELDKRRADFAAFIADSFAQADQEQLSELNVARDQARAGQ